MNSSLSEVDFIIRLGVAFGLGILIGIEREYRKADAGLRTTALVSAGAAMFVLATYQFLPVGEASPSRILAGVVAGRAEV